MSRRTKPTFRTRLPQQDLDCIGSYLAERSGYYVAEAVGVVLFKLVFLALAGAFAVLAVLSTTSEYLELWEIAILVVLCVVMVPLLIRYMLRVGYGVEVLAHRIGRANRFFRVRGGSAGGGTGVEASIAPIAGDTQVFQASSRGQGRLFFRTVLFTLLGLPAVVLYGYLVLAYLAPLWDRVKYGPIAGWPSWDEPEHFTELGEILFDDEVVGWTAVTMAVSGFFVIMAVALWYLAFPLLTRKGADALDLAVVADGVVTRGGLAIDWREIGAALIVEDTRIEGNLCRIAGHSRTRITLVLRDLPDVATRADRVQRRALYQPRDGEYGYVLCDLWCHDPDEVAATVTRLEAVARRAYIETARATRGNTPLWGSRYII